MMPAMANLSRIDYAVTCCVGGLLAIGGLFDVGSLGAVSYTHLMCIRDSCTPR